MPDHPQAGPTRAAVRALTRRSSTCFTAIASMIDCLSGKNLYKPPMETPAACATRLVVICSSGSVCQQSGGCFQDLMDGIGAPLLYGCAADGRGHH